MYRNKDLLTNQYLVTWPLKTRNACIYVTLHRKISHNAENERGNRSSTKLKLTNLLFYT